MSPSTSLKRDRLLQRNAILRRTGFIEAGAAGKGGFAGARSLGSAVDQVSCSEHRGKGATGTVKVATRVWGITAAQKRAAVGFVILIEHGQVPLLLRSLSGALHG